MQVIEWLKETLCFVNAGEMVFQLVRPHARCVDGFTMSIQHSRMHHCQPKEDGRISVESVEIGFPNRKEPLLEPYRVGKEKIYSFVPITVVEEICEKHGGITAARMNESGL